MVEEAREGVQRTLQEEREKLKSEVAAAVAKERVACEEAVRRGRRRQSGGRGGGVEGALPS